MKVLHIKGVEDYPTILMDKENNNFLIEGKSLPENALEYYTPVLEWLDEYSDNPNENTVLKLKIHYFNTASSKMILYILQKLYELVKRGEKVEVQWYYIEDDEDMLEAGEIYAERMDIPFKLIPM